ncbi:MAG TPA: ABC transporter ATP-binding protein [Acidimicrobiales bacterium]|nr:ABC transporter ATP-binding protein [Acidimicrobiales bacterium]
MLEISGVSASYGPVQALRDVTVQVPDGSVTAVLGANGAGKTTLLKTITGLLKPQAGTVVFDGHDLTSMKVEDIVRLGVAHVPEGRGVINELTVDDNLRLGAIWRRDTADRKTALGEMYDLFPPLAQRRRRSAFTLSGGERQMLVLGRALMSRPKALLLDEPSLGLAPIVTAQMMALLRDLSAEQGLTVLLVEQNAKSALSIATTGVVLSLGQVVTTKAAAELAADADLRHHYLGF